MSAAEHPENEAPQDPDATVPEDQQTKHKEVQVFQMTISLRDNWLHRGDALQDMDIQTYAELMERVEKPASGSRLTNGIMQQHFCPFRCPLQNEQWVHTSAQTGRAEAHCSVQRAELPPGECQRRGSTRTVQNVSLLTATLPRARSLR